MPDPKPAGGTSTTTVAAFDFDGTLTTRDTFRLFMREVATAATLARAGVRAGPTYLSGRRSSDVRDQAKEDFLAVALAGVSRSHAEATASRLASEILGLHLRDDVVERLRWHKANEHRVVVVSASFDAYVRPVAEHLGADAVLATRWDVDTCSGLLTGGLDGPNVRGHEKALRLQDWCNGGSRVGFAYGDSPGDAEMLAMADHPTLVTRSPMTRAPHY